MEVTDISDIMALANAVEHKYDKIDFDFKDHPIQFGTYNCVTHHICSDLKLFMDVRRNIWNISVRDISGNALAAGIGTMEFTLRDSEDNIETIRLDNMIYLPEVVKNIILIVPRSEDRVDACGILSRGKFSLFFWGNDKKVKKTEHAPSNRITLMDVNEKRDKLTLFVSSHEHQFIDKYHLTSVDSDEPLPLINREELPDWGDLEPPLESLFLKGDTVKASISGTKKIYVIDDHFKTTIGHQR